jgi:hypothetical protein
MNFAENQKWPSSRRWRGRPTDGVGESMRRGQSKRRAPPAKLQLQRAPACATTVRQLTSLGGGEGHQRTAGSSGRSALGPDPNPPQVPYLHRQPFVSSCTGLQAESFASDWIIVVVDPHETGRSGFTAYWGCPAAVGGTASDRRWMGSVGGWPMASLTYRATGGNHAPRTPPW